MRISKYLKKSKNRLYAEIVKRNSRIYNLDKIYYKCIENNITLSEITINQISDVQDKLYVETLTLYAIIDKREEDIIRNMRIGWSYKKTGLKAYRKHNKKIKI